MILGLLVSIVESSSVRLNLAIFSFEVSPGKPNRTVSLKYALLLGKKLSAQWGLFNKCCAVLEEFLHSRIMA